MAHLRKYSAVVSCLVLALAFALALSAAEPKRITAAAGTTPPTHVPEPEAILLSESFETSVPPAGWTLQGTHTGTETWYQETYDPYDGSYYASVQYDPQLIPQDEWLVSPAFNLAAAGGTVSLWSNGSVYWCRDTFDNCDLDIYLVVGAIGGGDDILLGTADAQWPESWTWVQSTYDIATHLPVNAGVGLHYTGTDGAQVNVDLVVLDGTLVPVELQRISIE